MATTTSAGAGAAALQLQEEEEEMTTYRETEASDGLEFKILRANLAEFRDPLVLKKVCEEEARAGWVLLEKFDDRRLRFKRPVSAKLGDAGLPFDPYRTRYGMSENQFAGRLVAIIFAVTVVIVLLTFAIISVLQPRGGNAHTVQPSQSQNCTTSVIGNTTQTFCH